MKLYLSHSDMAHFDAICYRLARLVATDADYNGVTFEISPGEFTYAEDANESRGMQTRHEIESVVLAAQGEVSQ